MRTSVSFVNSKVGRRIFLLFVLCALLPVSLMALVSLQRVSARLNLESHERLRQVGKNAGMTVLEGLYLLQSELESTTIPAGVSSWKPAPGGTAGQDRRFKSFRVLKSAAGETTAGGIGQLSPAARSHLAEGNTLILAGRQQKAGDPILLATISNRSLPAGGLLLGEVNPDYLWTMVHFTLPPGINVCVLGPSGQPIYSSLSLTPALLSGVSAKLGRSPTGQFEWQREHEDYLVNYWSAFMKPAFLCDAWTVVAVQSRQESLGPARSFLTTFLLVAVLTLFVVIFVSSVLIRRSLVPLAMLKDGAQRLSRGDFDSRVEIASNDEFQDLAVSFNDMSQQLGDQFGKLSKMGKLVQSILETHDREQIIDTVLSRFRDCIPCEWLAIVLGEGTCACQVQVSHNRRSFGGVSETAQCEVPLSEADLSALRLAGTLHLTPGEQFAALLSPLARDGASEFFLLSLVIKDRFAGILALGYQSVPERIREELVRSRQIADEIAVALDNIRLIDELKWLNWGTVEALAKAVDAKSPWTAGHSDRVTRLALEIGKEMGLSPHEMEVLHLGGLFHDIGKIGVPESILDNPGKLTDEEYAIIKRHPEKGVEILEPLRAYHEMIPIVGQHHERFDGLGYPQGLRGGEISLGARILGVADVFDALFSDRPYRSGWELGKVINFLREQSGSHFDPAVVEVFLRINLSVVIDAPAVDAQSGRGWVSA